MLDAADNPLPGATVQTGAYTAISDAQELFILSALPERVFPEHTSGRLHFPHTASRDPGCAADG